jgi:hypothetical protein
MLDTRHFHVVFTLPAELRPLAAFAPRVVYGALFRVAARTLIDFGQRRFNATAGATVVLHTWTRELRFHPHVHAIVTAGGLSADGRWQSAHRKFLFPVRALGQVFRAKMLAELAKAHRAHAFDRFDDFEDPEGFSLLMQRAARQPWNVYAKPSFARGRYVLAYLGRYTHRVGISNSRLLAVCAHKVTFRTKHGRTETLTPLEFLRRFVAHVLPDGLHKIRHVGLYAAACAKQRQQARACLGAAPCSRTQPDWRAQLLALTGRDIATCPRCGAPLVTVAVARCRDPPAQQAA